MVRIFISVLALTACSAIRSCCTPGIPNPPDPEDDSQDEHESSSDTGDTTPPVDTTPPPPCAQPEVEPNYSESTATHIALEQYACGIFNDATDFDTFTFSAPASWLEIDVNAAERGSAAYPILTLESDGGLAASSTRSMSSTDPYLLVPLPAPDDWVMRLTDAYRGYGEDFDYQVLVSVSKAPMEWGQFEIDQHDDINLSQEVTADVPIFGYAQNSTDFDWYHFRTPSGRNLIRVAVHAHNFGSPLDPRLQLYFANVDEDTGTLTGVLQQTIDDNTQSSGLDPLLERVSDGDEDWYFKVRYTPSTQFGDLYWYVLDVQVADPE